jgi:hypothetical protein
MLDRVPQEGFPTVEVYRPTPDAELRLITCVGDYDRAAGRYGTISVCSRRSRWTERS